MQSPRKATMQEKVASAAEAIERNARQDANFHNDESRSDIYAKLADPNSDWPEPRLQGGHVDDVKAHWLPQGQSPTGKGKATKVALRNPVTGGEDAVEGVNRDIGHGLGGLTQHGRHKGAEAEGPSSIVGM